MLLMAIIVIAFLTLATTTVHTSNQNSHADIARANARMALTLAIGNLQKYAGPDQRITARADIMGVTTANARLTGVWRSRAFDPAKPLTAADYTQAARDARFLAWLSSSSAPNANRQIAFANTVPPRPIALWDQGTLGTTATPQDIVRADKVTFSANPGAYAYAVLDEGLKVRINTPYSLSASNLAQKNAQLGSGEAPKIGMIRGLEAIPNSAYDKNSPTFSSIDKGLSLASFQLATAALGLAGLEDSLKARTHDISTTSQGLFTDVAHGGLKKDFNLFAEKPLAGDFASKGIYQTQFGLSTVNDPSWQLFHQFANIYHDSSRLTQSNNLPLLHAQGPNNWVAATGSNVDSGVPGILNPIPPTGPVLMPTIAKVQLVFSLATRDIYRYPKVSDTTPKSDQTQAQEQQAQLHDPWGFRFAGSKYDYLLHLLYTPVVTVHNPYNVAIEFEQLRVVFGNVPFGLKVIRNGIPQTNGLAPLDTMYFRGAEQGLVNKRFGMTLHNTKSNGEPDENKFRLLPGEVMLFSPYIDPSRTWEDEYSSGQRITADWDNNVKRTLTIKGTPGWHGDGIGFDLDWFCPAYNNLRVSPVETENGRNMNRSGCIGARAEDEFKVEFAPLSVPNLSHNKFTIEIFAKPTGAAQATSSGIIQMDYETPTGLQDAVLGANGTITFPKNGTINTMEMHSHRLTQIKDIDTVQPFAVVGASAKTTQGGAISDGEDGRYATKPWAFAHGSIGASNINIKNDGLANASHDFTFQALENGTSELFQYDPHTGRGNFVTGHTGATGKKFGVLYDIPLGPLQTLTDLNSANPAGNSGYLPRFAQPIGNSWAHPMLNANSFRTPGSAYELLDQSFLLNHALYDSFYFSGLASQNGLFGAGLTTSDLATSFAAGTPLNDPRLVFHASDHRPTTAFTTEINDGDAAQKIAAWQTMNGAFNINSTSVAAWKAMLASVQDAQAVYQEITDSSIVPTNLQATDANEARISRFKMPVSQSAKDGERPENAYWLGPREYSDSDLQNLAVNIVAQIRARGPFLSMGDFVNRQLGSASDEKAQRGTLQQAIDDSGLNAPVTAAADAGFDISASQVSSYGYKNALAGTGPSSQGAPGFLTQADLLRVLGNAATARSDTFTIRAYGEARDAAGTITATAYCEATVQREPEYLDPTDRAATAPADLTSSANQTFGRRFSIVSFRWLNANEI